MCGQSEFSSRESGKPWKKSASILSKKGSPALYKAITHCQTLTKALVLKTYCCFFQSAATAYVTDSCLCLTQ